MLWMTLIQVCTARLAQHSCIPMRTTATPDFQSQMRDRQGLMQPRQLITISLVNASTR